MVASLSTLDCPLSFKFTETSKQLNVLCIVLLETYSLGIESSLIDIPCYHYGDELIVYL